MAFRQARSLADFGRRRARTNPASDPTPERMWTPDPGPVWGPVAQLSPRIRMQAANGFRAAATQIGPGLYLVAEVPEETARAEFGLAPMLGPLMILAAQRALSASAGPRPPTGPMPWGPSQPQMPVPAAHAQHPGLVPWLQSMAHSFQPQPSPAAQLGWAHPTDLAQLGCGTTSCWRRS